MTVKLFKTAAEINKAITSIQGRGAKLDSDIQTCGLSVLAHAAQHGDTTVADKLVHAMPKGARKLALVEWMLAYGTIAKLDTATDKDAIAEGRLFKLDKARTLDLEAAAGTPWHEFKKEADVLTAFDAQAQVKGVLDRLTKAAKAGKTIEHRAEALASARALVATLEA